MKIECTPTELADFVQEKDSLIAMFGTAGFSNYIFFQTKEELLESVNAYPDHLKIVLGGGVDKELDEAFPHNYVTVKLKKK